MRLDYLSRQQPGVRRRIDLRIVGLLLVALALRLGWVLYLPNDPASLRQLPDQREYLELGENLLNRQGLKFTDPRFGETVYAFRMPGYPLFVALCGANLEGIRIAQAVVDTFTVLAVWLLARRWLSRSGSLFAAAIMVVNPFLIYFCGLILSETLFTAMLIWGMTLFVHRGRTAWLSGAILLIVSIFVRPSAIGLPVILGISTAFVNSEAKKPYDWRWSPPVGTLMLVLTLLAMLPWAWRNQRVLGSWVWTTSNSGITLYDGFNPDATGASDQSFTRTMPQLSSMHELARSQYLTVRAWEFIRENPRRVLELAVIKIARTWSPIPLSKEYGGDRKLMIVALAYMIPFYVLIILGLAYSDAPKAVKTFLLIPALYFTVIHAISVGSLRYRIPADVPMAVVAALAVGIHHFGKEPTPVPEAEAASAGGS